MRKDKFINFRPMKFMGGLFFLMAFIINVQISENGDWELVNVGYALEEVGGTPGITCPAWGQVGGSCHITIQRY